MYEAWDSRSFDPNFDILADGSIFLMGLVLLVCLRMLIKRIIVSEWVQGRMEQKTMEREQSHVMDNEQDPLSDGMERSILIASDGISQIRQNGAGKLLSKKYVSESDENLMDQRHEWSRDKENRVNYGIDQSILRKTRRNLKSDTVLLPSESDENSMDQRYEESRDKENRVNYGIDQSILRKRRNLKSDTALSGNKNDCKTPYVIEFASTNTQINKGLLINEQDRDINCNSKGNKTRSYHEKSPIHLNDEAKNQKAVSALYRFVFYFIALGCEILILRTEHWIFVPFEYTLTWKNNQTPLKIRIFYHIELAYYISGLYFLFTEKKLKDFTIMLIHHLVTITLIVGSFYYNLFRYGIVIMFIHDISDPIMEGAKFNLYLQNMRIANVFFVIFGIVFIIMRIIIYPSFIILPISYYAYIFNSKIFIFLCFTLAILLILHILWSRIIIKMACKLIMKDELLQADDREEIERKSK